MGLWGKRRSSATRPALAQGWLVYHAPGDTVHCTEGVISSGCPMPHQPRSLAFRHRSLSREWHRTRNGELTPSDVTGESTKKV